MLKPDWNRTYSSTIFIFCFLSYKRGTQAEASFIKWYDKLRANHLLKYGFMENLL